MRIPLRSNKQFLFFSSIIVALILIASVGFYMLRVQPNATALSASDFEAGRIIDDSVFYNKDSMGVAQIQAFLNQRIPNCDTWGTSPSGYGGTRAQYAASQGWHAPPYACLNNYHENPVTGETSYEKGGGAFAGGISAAQIIFDAAQQYGINPQVLLVMLKKESAGPLTSDSWPLKSQYKYAMGYACPDSGPNNSANCDNSLAGFYKQMTKAAWQLKYYKDHQNDYRYKIGVNQIQFSPDISCGTKTVNIENIATLSLYIYTPYTPNDGALANYPGTSPCGAYGNRNFFMYFKEWFGSPNYRAPTCDSKVTGVTCVWRLFDPEDRKQLLTISGQERDGAVINNKYSYDSIAFYAYTSQQPGTIPVYRIKMPSEYFYTASEAEKTALLQNSQNVLEGVAFYVLPTSTSTSTSYPVYRTNGPRGHLLTASLAERDTLVSTGYAYEGISFHTPSGFATAPTPAENRINVYRLNNGKEHLYTASLTERDLLLRDGWKNEGVLNQAPASQTAIPVYRVFNVEHMYTTSLAERDALVQGGWKNEGIGWYVDSASPQVYRFYTNNEHFYTADLTEAVNLTNKGGAYEGVAYGYNQNSLAPVYRMYNGAYHFFTASIDEVMTINNKGWRFEGTSWNVSKASSGVAVYRLSGPYHFFTASTIERDNLVKNGWKSEGIAWYTDETTPKVQRLSGPYHFFTASTIERDNLVKGGWKHEGVAW